MPWNAKAGGLTPAGLPDTRTDVRSVGHATDCEQYDAPTDALDQLDGIEAAAMVSTRARRLQRLGAT